MNVVDIVISVCLLYGLIKGIIKGLFVEVASLVGLVSGVYGAIHFSHFVKEYLHESVSWNPEYISLTAFSVTFIAIIIAISLLGKLLTKIANFAALGMVNKLLGGLFGMLKVGIIVSVLLIFITKVNATIPFVKKEILIDSLLYKPLKNIVPTLLPFIDDNALDEMIVKKSQNNKII